MRASSHAEESTSPLCFDQFTLDERRVVLTRNGAAVALRPKVFALLSYFVDHPGRVLGKGELLAAVWPGVVVTDDSLSQCVNELRAALGDRGPALIKTVPRRGYRFDAAVREAGVAGDGAPSRRNRWLLAGGAALMSALLIGASTLVGKWHGGGATHIDQAVRERRSIAVMPFTEQGDDKRGYFAEAVTDDLIANIARLPQTQVIARASAAAVGARETDVRKIGRELGVRYVLTGSVRRRDSTVHINAQFVSSESGALLWSEQFDYAGTADWAWERDIGLRIARTLDLQLSAAAVPAALRRGNKLEVIDAVMRASYLARHSASRADQLRARADFEAALAMDPDSLSALCGLALAHLSEVQSRMSTDPQGQIALAARAIDRALSLDPDDTLAHYARGHLLYVRGDIEGALGEYQRVLAANPSDAWSHARIGLVMFRLGRLEEVAPHIAVAQRLNPLEGLQVAFGHHVVGLAEFHLGNDDAAYERQQRAVAANPDLVQAWASMAAIDALHGRQAQAEQCLKEMVRRRPGLTIAKLEGYLSESATPERLQAGRRRYLEGLRKAGLPE
jgi:TolB-like protein/DNA-binding winged helix-turn-helix (wHTH) protein